MRRLAMLVAMVLAACGPTGPGASALRSSAPALDRAALADRVREEFLHAWEGYKAYAWGTDELLPVSRAGRDWHDATLLMTPVDALDTMILMGLDEEAERTREYLVAHLSFDQDISVKNFEINRGNADPRTWSWEIGSDDESSEGRRRDLSDPARFGQPAHMDEFRVLPIDAANDFGGVHLNNGIHSRAAFLVLTAASPQGGLLFPVDFVARLFYLAVTERLGPTARFSDSRRAVTAMAMSLVPQDPLRDHRLAAVARAFDEVGIMA